MIVAIIGNTNLTIGYKIKEGDIMEYWYYYWLTTIENIGVKKIKYLINTFSKPENIYNASVATYKQLSYLSDNDINHIVASKKANTITKEIEEIKNNGAEIISIDSTAYPEGLRHIEYPPYILYKKGNVDFRKPCIAIVGSRKCSEYGYTMAYNIAKDLTKAGVLIVSGLAQGIDSAAHLGALEQGDTVAVLGNGLNIYYPKHNRNLQRKIESRGCTLSEYPLNTNPHPGFFPARNRIISGICRGVLVVEAEEKSGSLITANYGLEQGRDVFAVPGNVWSKMSVGSNKLIQLGAKLVTGAEDILEEIEYLLPIKKSFLNGNNNNPVLNRLAQDERMVYDCLSQQPLYIDEVISETKITIITLQHIITSLELKGLIKRLPGQRLIRTE